MNEQIFALEEKNLQLQSNFTNLEEMSRISDVRCQKLDAKIVKLERGMETTFRKLRKIDSNLKKDIGKLSKRNRKTNTKIQSLTNGLSSAKAKMSNLGMKQVSLEKKALKGIVDIEDTERITASKIKNNSSQMEEWKTSLQKQTSNTKCQSGIVKSAYNAKKAGMISDQTVRFVTPFLEKPNIVFGLSLYHSSHKTNDRLKTILKKLDRCGFTLRISAWDVTILHEAHYFWMACP